jgi:DNA polymerase-3 subunit gamma/tau
VLAEEKIEAEPDALAMISRAADGSMRDALSLTDQSLSLGEGVLTADRVRDALGLVPEEEYLATLDLIAERRAGDVFPLIQRLAESGVDFSAFLAGLADMLRAQLAVVLGSTSIELSERAKGALTERRDRISAADLLRMLSTIGELEQRFRKSGQQQMLLETLLVRFALIDRSIAIEDVLRGFSDGGGSRGSSASTSTSRPAPPRTPSDSYPRRAASEPSAPPDRAVTPPVVRDQPATPRSTTPSATAIVAAPPPTRPLGSTTTVPSINTVVEKWDDVVATLRSDRPTLGPFFDQTVPSAVSASGVLTIRIDDAAAGEALDVAKSSMLASLQTIFPAIERVVISRPDNAPAAGGARRVTEEEIREQRMASLRKQDPVLGAAIDALDLELLD